MSWFLLSIITLIFWSGSDLFSKIGCRDGKDKYSHLKMITAVGLIMGIHALYEIFAQDTVINFDIILHYLPVSLLYILSMALGYVGLRYIELSVSSPICNSSGALAAIASIIFFGTEGMGAPHYIALILVCAGVVGLGFVEAHEDELERMVLEVNVDMGGATLGTNKIFVTADDGLRCLARAMADETGYLCDVTQDTYSSDSIPFADSGVPAINFARIATPGTLTVHNWQDSLEWMSPEPLADMTDFLIAFVARLDGAKRFPVEQEIPDNVREKIAAYLKRKPY